mmetsp:Transcript_2808/g.6434  ORF Transcript_2808/g.6434 Transcript_2808/m.6434 type:complete len:306 (-) Transcript_2808:190-1107(-)
MTLKRVLIFAALAFILLLASYDALKKLLGVTLKGGTADDKSSSNFTSDWLSPYLLSSIADSRRLIIFTTVNCGMADFAINWAISLSQLDIHNWIIICRDNACFKHLHLHYGDHIVKGPTMNNMISTTASAFNSEGFGALVKKRSFFVREILQQGYTALYSDVDMIWQKNPLPFLPGDKDLVVQNDVRKTDQSLNLCTCFFAIRPTRNSLRLLDVWEEEMKAENKNQAGFNRAAKRLQEGLSVHILSPIKRFPPGYVYFNRMSNQQRSEVVVVHANWVRGHVKKKKRLRRFGLWRVPQSMILPECK